jgi:hypothetical protein
MNSNTKCMRLYVAIVLCLVTSTFVVKELLVGRIKLKEKATLRRIAGVC